MTTTALKFAAPALGTSLTLSEKEEIWTVAAYEGDDTVILTREGVAPWTSMDQIMGNGACPIRGTFTMRFVLTGDYMGETVGTATFKRAAGWR